MISFDGQLRARGGPEDILEVLMLEGAHLRPYTCWSLIGTVRIKP